MRYTEARMQKVTMEMLEELDKDTVDFKGNYDDTRKEPEVFPSRIPNLLINGSSGIAVGMATNMPPHNIAEVCDAVIALIDDPEMEIHDLRKYVKGPDFPTGDSSWVQTGSRIISKPGVDASSSAAKPRSRPPRTSRNPSSSAPSLTR